MKFTTASVQIRARRAFTMIEIICAVSIMTLLSAFAVPAWQSVNGGTALEVASRQFAQTLHLARSEAIAQHRAVRFCVARDWESRTDASYRSFSLWGWDDETQAFDQLTEWERLPDGVVLEARKADYVAQSGYAAKDGATIRGDTVLEITPDSAFRMENDQVDAAYIEFLPSGTARVPGGVARQAIFVLVPGVSAGPGAISYTNQSGGVPTNWAQVNVDSLTGRARIHRP